MKILHFIESLGVGGAEILLLTQLPGLQRQGDELLLVVIRGPFDLREEIEAQGVRVIVLAARHRWNLIGAALEFSSLVREGGYDVVHAHLYFPAVVVALSRCMGLHNSAQVVSFHNLAYAPGVNKPGLGLWFKRLLAALLYPRGFDAAIGVSKAVSLHYARALGLKGVEVIYNPIDLHAIHRLALRALDEDFSVLNLVLPGRIVHEKGHIDFLHALVHLKDQGHEFYVTLAGDGPLRGLIEKEIEYLGLGDRILITGFLKHDQMLKTIASADIVVVPSRFEGFGLTALEAMALSRPVVASAVGGLPEIVEDGKSGILVPSQNPKALAEALAMLMTDPAMRIRLGAAGRKRVEKHFDLPTITSQLRDVYYRVTRSNPLNRLQ